MACTVWEVEGPRPVLGKGQIPMEVWRVVSAGKGAETSILFSPTACPPGSYKAKQGDGPCLPCPPNSRTTSPAAGICTCHNNFYRADSDSADSACTSEWWRVFMFSIPGLPSAGQAGDA